MARIFNCYAKISEGGKIEDLQLLRAGFSIFGFLFGIFWLFYNRIWGQFFLFFAVVLFGKFLYSKELISIKQYGFLDLILLFAIGMNYYYWHAGKLIKNGYIYCGDIFAKTKNDAIYKFLKEKYSAFLISEYASKKDDFVMILKNGTVTSFKICEKFTAKFNPYYDKTRLICARFYQKIEHKKTNFLILNYLSGSIIKLVKCLIKKN